MLMAIGYTGLIQERSIEMGMLEDALRVYSKYEDRTTNPSTPAAGAGLIYFKDGKIHSIDDAGTVVEYGASGGSTVDEDWTDYSSTSTIVGFSAFTAKYIQYMRIADIVFVNVHLFGTSNSSTLSFTLPYSQADLGYSARVLLAVTNNGTAQTTPGMLVVNANSNVANVYVDAAATVFATSNSKAARGHFFYRRVTPT
jgi:hypothetical protein